MRAQPDALFDRVQKSLTDCISTIERLSAERDEFRELLRELIDVAAEIEGVGKTTAVVERHRKAWAAARERFEP